MAAMNFGIDDALKADKLMIAEPKRPYYDAEAAARRRAEQIAKLKRELGFGMAVVLPVSDETMKRLNNESANRTTL